MICANENKLAKIIASLISDRCSACKLEGFSLYVCPLFNKDTDKIDRFNDRLPECKEMFKEVKNERE